MSNMERQSSALSACREKGKRGQPLRGVGRPRATKGLWGQGFSRASPPRGSTAGRFAPARYAMRFDEAGYFTYIVAVTLNLAGKIWAI